MSNERATIEECSEKVLAFLTLLKKHNPHLFSKWYQKGKSKKDALLREVSLDEKYVYDDILKNWDKKFDDLGARLSYWTGDQDGNKSVSISFNIGAYGTKTFNRNSCVLSLPKGNEYYDLRDNQEALISLFDNFWKPGKLLVDGEEILNK